MMKSQETMYDHTRKTPYERNCQWNSTDPSWLFLLPNSERRRIMTNTLDVSNLNRDALVSLHKSLDDYDWEDCHLDEDFARWLFVFATDPEWWWDKYLFEEPDDYDAYALHFSQEQKDMLRAAISKVQSAYEAELEWWRNWN